MNFLVNGSLQCPKSSHTLHIHLEFILTFQEEPYNESTNPKNGCPSKIRLGLGFEKALQETSSYTSQLTSQEEQCQVSIVVCRAASKWKWKVKVQSL